MSNLTDDVLQQILTTLRPVSLDTINSQILAIEQQQTWLMHTSHVSRAWRHISTPLLYRTLFVRIDTTHKCKQTSNISLVLANRMHNMARHIVVMVHGPDPVAIPDLYASLDEAGVFAQVWSFVTHVHAAHHISNLGWATNEHGASQQARAQLRALNSQLHTVLPAVQSIVFSDLASTHVYGQGWLDGLIRASQLSSLCVFTDAVPKIKETVCVSRLHIDGVTFVRPVSARQLRVQCDELVELTLSSVRDPDVWDIFSSQSEDGGLVFGRLRYLELVYFWESQYVPRLTRAEDPESEVEETEVDLGDRLEPVFPVLHTLCVRRYPGNLPNLLTQFARSQTAKSLIVAGLKHEVPPNINFSQLFPQLQALDVRIIDPIRATDLEYVEGVLESVFATPKLRKLSLSMVIDRSLSAELDSYSMAFAHTLRTLRLVGTIDPSIVEWMLHRLPVLTDVELDVMCVGPHVASIALLIQHMRAGTQSDVISKSVERLSVQASKEDASNGAVYRGLVQRFVSRMPRVYCVRVADDAVSGLRKAVRTLVASGVATAHAPHLQTLRILAWDL
ncbi:hypothetical protein GGH96_001335 [Coemansia sp. RSA 1972]|nr:hypothetical protein GGH96_001335 [Coemansia sp. RSA 1972]